MDNSATLSQPASQSASEPRKRRKNEPILAPWDQIESEFIRGATQTELAKRYGISEQTIGQRAYRGGWTRKRRQAESLRDPVSRALHQAVSTDMSSLSCHDGVSPAVLSVAHDLAAEQAAWKARMSRIAVKIAHGVEQVDTEKLGQSAQTKKLAEAASALASVDTIGRRQLGLENEQASQPVMLGVQFGVQVQVNGPCENPPPDDAA